MQLENFAVINCSIPVHTERESDVYVDHQGGVDSFFDGNRMIKKCTSWHSLSAAFGTEFFVYNKDKWQGIFQYDHVLVMVKDDLSKVAPLLTKLRKMGKLIGVAFHESGNYFSTMAQNLDWLLEFKKICEMGDYYWNVNACLESFFEHLVDRPVFSCWHAAPYEWKHDFAMPLEEREGIMIGTRTLSQGLRRDTLYAIGMADSVAREHDTFATYFSEDPLPINQLQNYFNMLGFANTKVIKGPVAYEEWLKIIASHRVLFHVDSSQTLGQVVADAAMVGVPSVGSESTNNQLLESAAIIDDSRDLLNSVYGDLNQDIAEDLAEFKCVTGFRGVRKIHQKRLFTWFTEEEPQSE